MPPHVEAADPDAPGRSDLGVQDFPDWLAAVDGQAQFEWARVAWRSACGVEGAWFDHGLADAVVAMWPTWATLTLDRFAGVPFRLSVWQELIVRLLVGWHLAIEVVDPRTHAETTAQVRLFRRLLLWIPRKNGKSEFLAALALLFFVLDGVTEGEGYVFARKEDQARIVFGRMLTMIANSPALKSEIIPQAKNFYVKALRATFNLLTGSDKGLHGKSPTVIVGDEMHEWKNAEILDTLRQGTGGRLQPIELCASTAGRKSGGHTAGEQLYEDTLAIIEGRKVEPTTLAVIFAANDDDDPAAEETWRRANPNLGLAPTLHFMRQELANADGNPRKMATFKCFHLGIWADEVSKWLPMKKWDACADRPDGWKFYADSLKGRPCYAAFDVSSTVDITALVLIFPPTDEDPKWRVLPRFWIPEDQVDARAAEGAPVRDFIAAVGHNGGPALEQTEGDYVDQNVVGRAIQEAVRDYDVQQIGFDPWNARKLVTDLQTLGAIPDSDSPAIDAELFVEMRQGIITLGEPSKHLERLVFEGVFDHGGHPVLRWMAANTVIHFDRNLNFMPAKDRSADKIDGIVAATMGVGLAGQSVDDGESVYDVLARMRAQGNA